MPGHDVLVETEEVRRIVAGLQFDQTLVGCGPIGRCDPHRALVATDGAVDTARRVRRQRRPTRTRPRDVGLSVACSGPRRDAIERRRCGPVADGRVMVSGRRACAYARRTVR